MEHPRCKLCGARHTLSGEHDYKEPVTVTQVTPNLLGDLLPSTTLLGIPLADLFEDERFVALLEEILRDRQENPEYWQILHPKRTMPGL